MHAPADLRQRKERIAALIYEKRKREERELQADLGERGSNGEPPRPGGLMHFIRYFWHILEPTTPLVEGWVMQAIALHLEAITRGEIKRCVINVPPGFCKSLMVNVFWPAWEWSAAGLTSTRYVTFSYGAHLTLRDNAKFRDLVQNYEFQELWGDVVKLKKAGEVKPENDATGWKFASSVGGIGTGERGGRVLCLPGDQRILTSCGWLPIKAVVEQRMPVKIAGLDHFTNAIIWQDIEEYERNPGNEVVEVECEGGSFRCTGDHPIFVQGIGYARADSLKGGEQMVWTRGDDTVPPLRNGDLAQAQSSSEVLQPSLPANLRTPIGIGDKQPSLRDLWDEGVPPSRAYGAVGSSVLQQAMLWEGECRCKQPKFYRLHPQNLSSLQEPFYPEGEGSLLLKEMCRSPHPRQDACRVECAQNMSHVSNAVCCEIQEARLLHETMRGQSAFISHGWQRQWPLCSRRSATEVSSGMDANSQSSDPGARRTLLPTVWPWTRPEPGIGRASHQLQEGGFAPDQPDHVMQVLPWQDARRKKRPSTLETRVVRSVKAIGWEDVVYNVRVAPCHNYFAEGYLVHNCDDLHSVRYAESEQVRGETVRWVREGMSNRLNSMLNDVILGIGQRVHEDDASAAMLEDPDYVHLMIPMEYDAGRHCATKIGWEDPRTEDGELAWPERFPREVVEKLKKTLGPYAYSAQYQQAPTPRGGAILKREWWQLWTEDEYPPCYFKWASADTAYTEKEENDPTGFTVWGMFDIGGQPNIILMDAWRKRLELHIAKSWYEDNTTREARHSKVLTWQRAAMAEYKAYQKANMSTKVPSIHPDLEPWQTYISTGLNTSDRWPDETYEMWRLRTQEKWGLCEWLIHSCRRFKVNELLIEGKASGLSVAQEVRRLAGNEGWGVQTMLPEGDKTARAYAVSSILSAGLVWAPEREWSDMAISEANGFPKGRYKDVTDSMTQALKYVRDIGLLIRPEERELANTLAAQYRPQTKPLYPV